MPPMLIHALKSWGGTQDVVTSLAGGEVSFQPRVAMRVGPLSSPLYFNVNLIGVVSLIFYTSGQDALCLKD